MKARIGRAALIVTLMAFITLVAWPQPAYVHAVVQDRQHHLAVITTAAANAAGDFSPEADPAVATLDLESI